MAMMLEPPRFGACRNCLPIGTRRGCCASSTSEGSCVKLQDEYHRLYIDDSALQRVRRPSSLEFPLTVSASRTVKHTQQCCAHCDLHAFHQHRDQSEASQPTVQPWRRYASDSYRVSASSLTLHIRLTATEHFSTPLEFAKKHYGLDAKLIPYPSGTGHMVTALQSNEIDIGVGLTEGWIAALGKAQAAKEDAGFSVVGTYVETPLCWAISTGARRNELNGIQDLKSKKVGVSRIGSGSYVMSFVLADQQGWLDTTSDSPPFPVEPLNTFANLRDGVNDGTADFFMWEHFTSKRYYDNGEIKRIGEIYTPWSSWKIVAANHLLNPKNWSSSPNASKPVLTGELDDVMDKVNKGVRHFEENQEEAVQYISTKLDYSEEDAREWLKTVRFAKDVKGVDKEVVNKTVGILQKAGVLGGQVDQKTMIGLERRLA